MILLLIFLLLLSKVTSLLKSPVTVPIWPTHRSVRRKPFAGSCLNFLCAFPCKAYGNAVVCHDFSNRINVNGQFIYRVRWEMWSFVLCVGSSNSGTRRLLSQVFSLYKLVSLFIIPNFYWLHSTKSVLVSTIKLTSACVVHTDMQAESKRCFSGTRASRS